MGWLNGILSGYADRQGEIRQENAKLAEQAAQREAGIYQALLDYPDDDVRTMAATGILSLGQPRARASGLAGWMGKMQESPVYPLIQKYFSTPRPHEVQVTPPGLPSTQTQGYLTLPPGQTSSLAQPEHSPTDGGEMAAPQPLPGTQPAALTPPPAPPGQAPIPPPMPMTSLATERPDVSAALTAEPLAAEPLTAEPTTPIFRSGVEETLPQPPPAPPASSFTTRQVPGAPPTLRTEMRRPAFPSKIQQDVQGLQQVFHGLDDPNWQRRGAEAYLQEHMRTTPGVGEGDAQPVSGPLAQQLGVPDGTWMQPLYDKSTGNLLRWIPAGAKGAAGSTRALTKREEIAAGMFGAKYGLGAGTDPTAVMRKMSPQEHLDVLREEGILNAEAALQRARQLADAPLSAQAKSDLTEKLNTKWQTLQAPLRKMVPQLQRMNVGVNRYREDPNGASQAVLVTFQQMLDPTSVVRESEYARSATGLPVMSRLQGMYDRLVTGGAGVPESELRAMAETARQFIEGMEHYNDDERQRITDRAAQNGIDPGYIFGGGVRAAPPPPPPGAATAAPTSTPTPTPAPGTIPGAVGAVYDPKTGRFTW